MKTLLRVLSLLTILVGGISIPAFAQTASGKAVVPPFDSRLLSANIFLNDDFFITNITSSPINVTINVYNQTGSIVTTGFSILPGTGAGVSSFTTNSGGSSVSLTLAANSTTAIVYIPTALDCGYATIAWTQPGSSAQFGLIADVLESVTSVVGGQNTYAHRTLAVNNNMPF